MQLTKLAVKTVLLAASGCAVLAQTQDDFFDDSVIHEIRLTVNARDWQSLKTAANDPANNTYFPAIFQWRNVRIEDAGIRNRGKSSRTPIKPELNVDFNRFVENQLFLGMTGFKLDNNVTDASMVSEKLAMQLFRKMGLPYLREAHARVYVNNEFMGLYTIVENPNKNFLRRVFGEDEGYLYEFDWVGEYRFEWKGDAISNYSPAPFDPQTHELNPNPAPLRDMIRVINQASDSTFQSAAGEYVDWKNFLTHLALEMFIAESDGLLGEQGMANFYVYNPPNSKRFYFIVWDKDGSFGDRDLSITKNADRNVLVRRALAVPELKTMYLEAVLKAAALTGGPDGWLAQEIEKLYAQIRDAVRADTVKPCTTDVKATCPIDRSNELFEINFQALRAFARERSAKVLAQVAAAGYQAGATAPVLGAGGVVNASPGSTAPIPPGSWASIYGLRLGSEAAQPPLGLTPNGVSFWINGFSAPIGFVVPSQANVQVPWEVAAGTVKVTAIVNGVPSNAVDANVAAFSPGIFAVAHGADGTKVTDASPARAAEVIVLYANGLGPVDANLATGQVAPANPLAYTKGTTTVTVGGAQAQVQFSGLTPGFIGLYQVNAQLPASLAAGNVNLVLSSGGASATPVVIAVK